MKLDIRAAVRAELSGAAEHAELARWTDEELWQSWAATHDATLIAKVVSDRVTVGEKPLTRPGRKASVRGKRRDPESLPVRVGSTHEAAQEMGADEDVEEQVSQLVEPDGDQNTHYGRVLQAIADQLNTWMAQDNQKVKDLHERLHSLVSDCATLGRELDRAVENSNVD